MRRLLTLVLILGLLGTGVELILLEHYETWQQWLPLALLALGLGAAAAVRLRPCRRTISLLRGIAVAFLISAALGIYFHLDANFEFERERDATLGGSELVWEMLTGAMPALAPGSMVLLGLIGFVITAGHPALQSDSGDSVAALAGERPFADMLEVDAALEGVLDQAAREDAYRVMWIPLDLNAATREEILLIPGVGDRMAGEFEEYRPYEAMAEFRREIGKYVDEEEVERLAGYVMVR